MLSVRDAFFNQIYELVNRGEDIIVVTSDLGAPSLDDFRKCYPERYISVGIAEQSLISIAAGLSLSGKKVVAYGLNPFPVTRAFDQIRSLLAELKIPITLCGLNAGLCSAQAGYTHMPIEDMGMMRMLSNIQTVNPSDICMAQMLGEEVLSATKARYIRFDKAVTEKLYHESEIDFNKGFTAYGRPGNLCVVTLGCYIPPVRKITEELLARGERIQLIDLFAMPTDTHELMGVLCASQRILTVEENVLPGGVGSYILEVLSDGQLSIPVKRLGLHFENGYYNVFTNREYIRECQKTDEKSIVQVICSLL